MGFSILDKMITNPNFGWPVVAEFLFNPAIMTGLVFALWMMVVTMVIGVAIGTLLAVMRTSRSAVVSQAAWAYIWFFRGTPLLVQIIFWFNIAALFPQLELGIPFGPAFIGIDSNALITPMSAAILALGLNEAAYMAEIIRGGLLGVDKGQDEAARALGMKPPMVFRIVFPQAIRIIIPATANQVINAFKNTSLLSVIGVADLLYSAQIIYSDNFQTIPLLIVASFWYLLTTSFLGYGQGRLEKRYSRGFTSRKHKPKISEIEIDSRDSMTGVHRD
jgi:polar amino acid transport system permease protein